MMVLGEVRRPQLCHRTRREHSLRQAKLRAEQSGGAVL